MGDAKSSIRSTYKGWWRQREGKWGQPGVLAKACGVRGTQVSKIRSLFDTFWLLSSLSSFFLGSYYFLDEWDSCIPDWWGDAIFDRPCWELSSCLHLPLSSGAFYYSTNQRNCYGLFDLFFPHQILSSTSARAACVLFIIIYGQIVTLQCTMPGTL